MMHASPFEPADVITAIIYILLKRVINCGISHYDIFGKKVKLLYICNCGYFNCITYESVVVS
jgi:hypothetical protein